VSHSHKTANIFFSFDSVAYSLLTGMYMQVYETPLQGNSPNNHRDFSNFIRDMERIALLRRGGWVTEWIAYLLLDLFVSGSNTGGETTRRS